MRLGAAFIRLPLNFDVDRLRAEVEALSGAAWQPDPRERSERSTLPLLAPDSDAGENGAGAALAPTEHLKRSEYLRQALAGLGTVLGETRLVRFDGAAEEALDLEEARYWAERVRVHIPVLTSRSIEFACGDRSEHLAAGEAWVVEALRPYEILNPNNEPCVHLVTATVGSDGFWRTVEAGRHGSATEGDATHSIERIPFRARASVSLETEHRLQNLVMVPWEQEKLCRTLLDELEPERNDSGEAEELRERLRSLTRGWRAAWAQFGPAEPGWPEYRRLLDDLARGIAPLEGKLRLRGGADAVEVARRMLVRPAFNPDVARRPRRPGRPGRLQAPPRRFERPIFIVSPPRSGNGLMFDVLGRSPSIWAVRRESHAIIERLPALHPGNLGWDSNRLTATDALPRVADRLRAAFLAEIRDRDGNSPPEDATGLRMLEKTEKNALRVPFFNAVFPDAVFVYIHREPRESLAEMVAAWESKRFVTYPQLPGWPGPAWSLVLTPEWRKLAGKPLVEVVAEQWSMATRILLADLEKLSPERWCVVDYGALLEDPQREVERLCEFIGVEWDQKLAKPLPDSHHAVRPPDPERAREHEAGIEAVLPRTSELAARARDWVAHPPADGGAGAAAKGSPFRSSITSSLPEVLGQLGGSLVVTTYQTGKLVCVRRTGDGINTHFRNFESPMGLAWSGGRLAVGTRSQVFEYQNLPDVAAKIEPRGSHDACFVPRRSHYTGDIRIHDVAYAGGELWIVATRFSCLATLDDEHSFVPRWRPPFVSALAPEDRCHLNGLAVIDDRVRYATALGASDEAAGWRENKARGGVLIDLESSETAAGGLSMPHSPRWYRNRLWLLESGEGTLAAVDLDAGSVETVVELPGFTRGLAFAGPLAFVGLSEVRESSTFGGLPLTGRLEERQCGVWVVNIETGGVVGFLRFEDLVQEIFDVKFLPGIRFPDIAEHGSEAVNSSYVLPSEALAQVPSAAR